MQRTGAGAWALALWLIAVPLAAGPKKTPENDFLIRTLPSEIDGIASRNGLTVIEEIDVSADALGRHVYLVRAPQTTAPELVLEQVADLEPEAVGVEEAFVASLPESYAGLNLDQSFTGIVEKLQDSSEVIFGKDELGNDRSIWQGFVTQEAGTLLAVDQAQATHKGNATVAIIDTGIDPDHPLLEDRIVPGYDFTRNQAGTPSEWDDLLDQSTMVILDQSTMVILDTEEVVTLNQSTMVILDEDDAPSLDITQIPPAFGHGTMVAGIIHRVAPEADLMPLKAFDANGEAHVFDIVRAIYYAVDNGANVINMSFSLEAFSPELMRAVNYAARKGVTCVASAGNSGRETMVYPAAFGNTIGVASTDDDDYLSGFSNHGEDLVTVAAPGENIITTYPGGGWAAASGTSFAAPWISGAVALFADKNGKKNNPGKADYYLAADALAHTVPVHGITPGQAGYGRADLATALAKLEQP